MRFDSPPKREDYETQEQFENDRSRWQQTAGRNQAIRAHLEKHRLERDRATAAEEKQSLS